MIVRKINNAGLIIKTKRYIVPVILALLMTNYVFSDPVRLSEADNGCTNSVEVGGEIEILLEGNPTTGYQWSLAGFTTNQIQQVGEVNYRQFESKDKVLRVGVGGRFVFKFKAIKQGQSNIKLIYRRSWETTVCDKVYSVVIEIK